MEPSTVDKAPRVEAVPTAIGQFPSRGFRALWLALSVSQFGSAVSVITIPVIAVVSLGATAQQMGVLTAMGVIPSFLIRVPAATWSDRLTRRVPLLAAINLTQATVIALIPLLWWRDALGFAVLLALIGMASLLTGISSSLSSPILVDVVPKVHLVTANGRLSATRSVADISGPGLGAALLAVLAAPFVVLADAASFVLSALLLTQVRERSAQPVTGDEATAATTAPDHASTDGGTTAGMPATPVAAESAPSGTVRPEISVLGLGRALLGRTGVQALVAVAFVNGVVDPVLVLFMVRQLHLSASMIGVLLGLGAVGGVTGGLLVGRLMTRWGPGRTLAAGTAVTLASLAVLPFATRGFSGAAGVVVFELAGSLGGTLMVATVFGLLQGAAPDGAVARVMALAMTFLQVATVVGALAGGLLGTYLGLRSTLFVAAALFVVTLMPLLLAWRAAGWIFDEDREIR
ncbi:MFS transporter [Polymorphospora rubra]|uniref:MFS transporter n=1 Tax=Polymorphospora rubra TaxID=338584 RepID=UPI0034078F36